ncbi:Peroxisomal membrane protein PMP27 [Geranomyces variabilis]|nr:Peroxisomal membrane protein PMP27 [Geranomyces variabilis]
MSSAVYSPQLHEHIVKYLATSVGRDRIHRFVQYFSRFLVWHGQRNGYEKETLQRLTNLMNNLGSTRKLMRVGRQFEFIRTIQKTASMKDDVARITITVKNVFLALWLLCDSCSWQRQQQEQQQPQQNRQVSPTSLTGVDFHPLRVNATCIRTRPQKQSIWDRLGDKPPAESSMSRDRRRRSSINESSPRQEPIVSMSIKGASHTARKEPPRRIVKLEDDRTEAARVEKLALAEPNNQPEAKSSISLSNLSLKQNEPQSSTSNSRSSDEIRISAAAESDPAIPASAVWEMCHSRSSGKPYYYNRITGKSVWTEPAGFDGGKSSELAQTLETHGEGDATMCVETDEARPDRHGNGSKDASRTDGQVMPGDVPSDEKQQQRELKSQVLRSAELEPQTSSFESMPQPQIRWENRYGVRVSVTDVSSNLGKNRRDPELDALAAGIDEEECRRSKAAMVEQMLKDLEYPLC